MHPVLHLVSVACLIMLVLSPAWGAQKYTRKSVVAVRSIAVTDGSIRLNAKQTELFNEALENHLILARFDQALLPDRIRGKLNAQLSGKVVSGAEMQRILDTTVATDLVKILQATLEYRANYDTPEFNRRNFINTKAKEIGITAEDFERMMDCAYLYVPYLSKLEISGTGEQTQVSMAGGLHWYHLSLMGAEGPHVQKMGQVQSSASGGPGSWTEFGKGVTGFFDKFKNYQESISTLKKSKESAEEQAAEESLTPEQQAFRNAANKLALNLSVKTRNHDKLKDVMCTMAPIADTDGSNVFFHLGNKEGLIIDDRYEVIDLYEDETGRAHKEKVGHCMVMKIAENRAKPEAMSRAKAIIGGGNMGKGMEVREVARMGIDLSIRPLWSYLAVDSLPTGSNFTVAEPSEQGAIGADLALELNIGRRLNISQFFVSLGAAYGYVPLDMTLQDEEVKQGHLYGFHGGLMKRFYLGRPAFRLDVDYGWYRFNIIKSIDDMRYHLHETFTPVRAGAGLEIALTTNTNMGLYGGYQYVIGTPKWRLSVEDSGWALDEEDSGVEHQGFYAGLAFTYALASLGWNPF
jgi:hypothetical protein